MIIGINGKIGSGKDTVGKIIQWLTKPELDGQYVGFQTYDDITLERCSSFKIKKFAGKLKQTASLLTGIPVEKFEDQEFKKTYLGEEWNSPYNIPFSGPDFVEHDGAMTVRTLLQRLGTEAMRDNLHENVWVNALFADYKALHKKEKQITPVDTSFDESTYPNWIITDMRFPNELEAIVKRKGITIRVVRDLWKPNPGDTILIKVFSNWSTVTYTHTDKECRHHGVGTDGFKYGSFKIKQPDLHPSETSLDDAIMHYEIINNGTIEDLIERVKEILIKEGII